MIDDFPGFENDFQDSRPDESTGCCGNPLRGCMDCPPIHKNKLTFEEWTSNQMNWNWNAPIKHEDLFALWHAAQENV